MGMRVCRSSILASRKPKRVRSRRLAVKRRYNRWVTAGKTPGVPCGGFFDMEKQISVSQIGISDWVAGLAAIPEREFTLQNVQDYIIAHAVKPETLDQYLFFSKG